MIFQQLAAVLWSPPLFLLLFFVAAYFTIKLRTIQLRLLPFGLKEAFFHRGKAGEAGDISPFQALMTALSSTIGTGNIVGISSAVVFGGPGAIFWLWVAALLLMAVKYSEGLLAVKYRRYVNQKHYVGGPMYYIRYGLGKKNLAALYALSCVAATFGIGNMVQANAIGDAVRNLCGVPPMITGIAVSLLVGMILLGGIQRIGRVAGVVTPFMAGGYFLCCLVFLLLNLDKLPDAFITIVKSAFAGMEPIVGGFGGATLLTALRYGVSRGVFANEAGLGNSAIAAAAAKTDSPSKQGLVSMTGTFLDTLVVCTMTALVIVVSGLYLTAPTENFSGAALTANALNRTLPWGIGHYIVNISLILFAFTSIIGWSYYGEASCRYLWGNGAVNVYKVIFVLMAIGGSVIKSDSLWYLSDFMNGVMMIINLWALFLLRHDIIDETFRFSENYGKGRSLYR